jgi:hypothetical protein
VLAPPRADTYPTLVIGAPAYGGRDDNSFYGVVHLINGSTNGPTAAGNKVLTPHQLPQQLQAEDFGRHLTS